MSEKDLNRRGIEDAEGAFSLPSEPTSLNYDVFRQLMEWIPPRRDLRVFINPADVEDVKPADAHTDIPVVTSQFVAPGQAYLMDASAYDLSSKLREDMWDRMRHALEQDQIRLWTGLGWGYPQRDVNRRPVYFRKPGESVMEWGDRLQKLGVLDDPKIRAEYQHAVMRAIVRVPSEWINKFLKRGRDV